MCNNFLENMHRILVYVRSDIYNNENIELVRILSLCISENMSNDDMVNQITNISPVLKQQLILQDDEIYQLNTEAKDYVLNSLQIILNELKEKDYDLAYEMVDALHVFPHVVITNDKRQIKSYWKVFVKPIIKRIRNKGYDVRVFKSCRM